MAGELVGRMQRQVAGGRGAGVEMLVEPVVWGHQHAALLPGTDHALLALFPHDRVALAAEDDNAPAWSVTMGLLIGTRVEHRHMAEHLGLGKVNKHHTAARAPALVADELVPGEH